MYVKELFFTWIWGYNIANKTSSVFSSIWLEQIWWKSTAKLLYKRNWLLIQNIWKNVNNPFFNKEGGCFHTRHPIYFFFKYCREIHFCTNLAWSEWAPKFSSTTFTLGWKVQYESREKIRAAGEGGWGIRWGFELHFSMYPFSHSLAIHSLIL